MEHELSKVQGEKVQKEDHSLLPHLVTYIPQRHPILILHDSAPRRMFRNDDDLLHAGEGGRFVNSSERKVSVGCVVEAAGGAYIVGEGQSRSSDFNCEGDLKA